MQQSAGNNAVGRLFSGSLVADMIQSVVERAQAAGSIGGDLVAAMAAAKSGAQAEQLGKVLTAMGPEHKLVAVAAAATAQTEIELTDVVFKIRHPERATRRLRPRDPADAGLIKEWIAIRRQIVRPVLAKIGRAGMPTTTAGPKRAPTPGGGPRGGEQEIDHLDVDGDLSVGRSTTVGTRMAIGSDWHQAGPVTVEGDLIVQGSLTVRNDMTVGGRVKAARMVVKTPSNGGGPGGTRAAGPDDHSVDGSLFVATALSVGGWARLGGKTKVFGSVTVGHDAVIDGPLAVAGDIKVAMRFHWNKP